MRRLSIIMYILYGQNLGTVDSPLKILSCGFLTKKYTSIQWEKIHMTKS